ncbi:MAG TPA: hypothetical protein VI776_16485 [Anaerolineales bacterium]|nr:hypothetical protein [Anaerolineales bacterium]
MSTIELDLNLAKKLDQGMRSGGIVELPFPVVYIWALNGQSSYKTQGGALYYGGWASKTGDLESFSNQLNLEISAEWKLVTIASRDGAEFDAYTTRTLTFAPIGKRESWLYEGKRFTDYIEGGRRHLQVLAYLAEAKGDNGVKQFNPWGPVVLTAKGYQARNLLDALARWEKATSQIRWKVSPGIPAWCFYMTLGTYGKERQAINVGKPGAQSPITPISAYIPEKVSESLLSSLFVGSQVASNMANLQDQASDWLNAWKIATEIEAEEIPEPIFPPEEEEIPF